MHWTARLALSLAAIWIGVLIGYYAIGPIVRAFH
jgi:hypothetical protein